MNSIGFLLMSFPLKINFVFKNISLKGKGQVLVTGQTVL